jgi:hypothetical protein
MLGDHRAPGGIRRRRLPAAVAYGKVGAARVGGWTEHHDATDIAMNRGFHAFFRQYYNLRSQLHRVDPQLSMLTPVDDYPLVDAACPEGLSTATLPVCSIRLTAQASRRHSYVGGDPAPATNGTSTRSS